MIVMKNPPHHQRNPSEIMKVVGKDKVVSGKTTKKHLQDKSKSKIYSLVQKSAQKEPKTKIVERLNNYDEGNKFFAFGQNRRQSREWKVGMEKISEAQDSNSRRQLTSHRSHYTTEYPYGKQNQNISNFDLKIGVTKKSKGRNSGNRKKTYKSKNDKSKSTISLSRTKLKSHREAHREEYHNLIRERKSSKGEVKAQKIEKSLKMLWECVGELWQNTRISQYKSEKNAEKIEVMKRCIDEQGEKILEMKNIMQRKGSHSYALTNLRY